MEELTPVPGAESRYDDDGREIVEVLTCGTCGRSWNDAAVSSVTPVPSGRCPFEYDHEAPDEDDEYQCEDCSVNGEDCRTHGEAFKLARAAILDNPQRVIELLTTENYEA